MTYDRTPSDILLLYAARGLRGFGDGFAIIILPAYLSAIGFSSAQVGVTASASLLGTALFTLAVGLIAPRHDLRTLLLGGALLMVATGLAYPNVEQIAFVATVAFVGTVNPSTGDLGVLVPLEHAMLAHGASNEARTRVFARYSLIGALSMAAGSLAAAAPDLMSAAGIERLTAFKFMFYAYAALGLTSAALYRLLPHVAMEDRKSAPLGPSRRVVYKLAALFSIDAFAGGFVVQSLLALWLFETLRPVAVGGERVLLLGDARSRAFSYPVAAWIAKRIGLVNTMVFTHIPSSIFLILAAFSPNLYVTLALLLAARGAVANGRADAHLLRHGGGDAGRARSGCEHYRGAAQPRLVAQPGDGRRPLSEPVLRPAAGDLRHAQDRLRCRAAVIVSACKTAGGTGCVRPRTNSASCAISKHCARPLRVNRCTPIQCPCRSMSASLRKRPNCCVAAKCR